MSASGKSYELASCTASYVNSTGVVFFKGETQLKVHIFEVVAVLIGRLHGIVTAWR